MALALTYRRLFRAWIFFPKWLLVYHVLAILALAAIDLAAGGRAAAALAVALALLVAANRTIRHLATTPESLRRAFERNEVRLPVFALLAGCVAARWWIGPVLDSVVPARPVAGLADRLLSSPLLIFYPRFSGFPSVVSSLLGATRLALAALVLGLAVVARYVGPQSISKFFHYFHVQAFAFLLCTLFCCSASRRRFLRDTRY